MDAIYIFSRYTDIRTYLSTFSALSILPIVYIVILFYIASLISRQLNTPTESKKILQ